MFEKTKKGLLIVSSTENGETLRNVIAAIFSEIDGDNTAALPDIDKVLFLENPNLNHIKISGVKYEAATVYSRILNDCRVTNNRKVEIRHRIISDYMKDIPEIILSGIHEVEPDNVLVDITNGKRDLAAALHTSALLSKVHHVIYVVVEQDSERHFYDLREEENAKKYRIESVKRINNVKELSFMGRIDYVDYHENIRCFLDENDSNLMNLYCVALKNAIEDYFNGKYQNAIRDIGAINEDLIGRMLRYFRNQITKTEINEIKSVFNNCNYDRNLLYDLRKIQDLYSRLERKIRDSSINGNSNKLLTVYNKLKFVLGDMPSICYILYIIKDFRNVASHSISDTNTNTVANTVYAENSARFVIIAMINVINCLLKPDLGIICDEYIIAD